MKNLMPLLILFVFGLSLQSHAESIYEDVMKVIPTGKCAEIRTFNDSRNQRFEWFQSWVSFNPAARELHETESDLIFGVSKLLRYMSIGSDRPLLHFPMENFEYREIPLPLHAFEMELVEQGDKQLRRTYGFFNLHINDQVKEAHRKQPGFMRSFEWFVVYINTDRNKLSSVADMAATNVLCKKLDSLDISKLVDGQCYWLDGKTARHTTGEPYCW